jgi:hypothetical protein
MKALLLSTAVATFAAIGTASAQPFDMSRGQADQITAGGGEFPNLSFSVEKDVQEQALKLFLIKAQLESKPNVKGHFAHAEAGATAEGHNTFTETTGLTDTGPFKSSSFSEATSASTGGHRHRN